MTSADIKRYDIVVVFVVVVVAVVVNSTARYLTDKSQPTALQDLQKRKSKRKKAV